MIYVNVCDDVIVLFSDFNYNGFYVNGDDSDDFKRAKGFNYHQGPVSKMSYVQYMVSQWDVLSPVYGQSVRCPKSSVWSVSEMSCWLY